MILEPPPGTPATNETDSNADILCVDTNFIVMSVPESKANMYPCNTSYEPIYDLPIVNGASTYMNRNIGRSFIIVINEALYYGKKPGH